MRVLLSIKPEHAEKILAGEKRYEFRKAIPRRPGITTVVIYATLPVGKVVGEFDVEAIHSEGPASLWARTREHAGISRQFFRDYFRDRATAHAIAVRQARRYARPVPLRRVLESGIAPQSFCYLRGTA